MIKAIATTLLAATALASGAVAEEPKPPRASLAEQANCLVMAKKASVEKPPYKASNPQQVEWDNTTYTAHYDPQMAKCYAWVKSDAKLSPTMIMHSELLLDAGSLELLADLSCYSLRIVKHDPSIPNVSAANNRNATLHKITNFDYPVGNAAFWITEFPKWRICRLILHIRVP